MKPTNFPGMPDTSTPRHRVSRGWYTIRLLALVITPLALGLTLFAPTLWAQDSSVSESENLYAQSSDDDQDTDNDQDTGTDNDSGDSDASDTGDDGDNGVGEDQYDTEDNDEDTQVPVDSNGQPLRQNPNTGGSVLLPVVGVVGIAAWSAVGISLLPRRNRRA